MHRANSNREKKEQEEATMTQGQDLCTTDWCMAKQSDGDFSRHLAESSSLRTLRAELDVRLDEQSDGVCEF